MSAYWTELAIVVGMLLACRLAYGSWPWESRKAWHYTKGEIQYLRDVQENQGAEQ